ncbi:MAG: alpha/beta fold hydrolase [Cytophagaceae bacterium]|nr:alpha/beta fold hydrolase [Cytophagaceae bacterium]
MCALSSFCYVAQSQNTRDQFRMANDTIPVKEERLELYDYSRSRSIPVALYLPDSVSLKQKLVIFNHGYAENQGTPYLSYNYLNSFLAQHGYLVVSIQQELPTDDPLPMNGNLREKRMPNWENGLQNILFVVKELKSRMPNIDDKRYNLIGHSNGGDISMYFATEYPKKISKVISLDNRRMPLPKIDSLKVYSIRSNDLPADDGVLPTPAQQINYGMTIVTLPNTKHIEMSDETATEEQKKEIREYVLKFLEEKR